MVTNLQRGFEVQLQIPREVWKIFGKYLEKYLETYLEDIWKINGNAFGTYLRIIWKQFGKQLSEIPFAL